MPDYYERSVRLHEASRGKIEVRCKVPLMTRDDLSLAYTPGVARPCEVIASDPARGHDLTMRGNSVCVLSDGTAVLGLGDIGPEAALPVMEGKACLFKEFAGIDAVPLCVRVAEGDKGTEQLIAIARSIAPTFGGINMEDIAAPRCFAVEDALQDLGIPVMHDDQHGTAMVLLAAVMNSVRVVGKPMESLRVVVNGAGAAGTAIAKMLLGVGMDAQAGGVADVVLCDTKGVIGPTRQDLNAAKRELLRYTNRSGIAGTLRDALAGADVFVGVSKGNILTAADIRTMSNDAMIFALANPVPEIEPHEARRGGAAIVCTGRSDHPNQVNNVLAFPGIFRGALDARATGINGRMKLACAHALASMVPDPSAERVLPDPLDRAVAPAVARAVAAAWCS